MNKEINMPNTLILFRVCVFLEMTSYLIWFFLPFWDSFFLTDKEIQVLTFNNYGALINYTDFVINLLLAVYIAILLGLLLFNRIARILYLLYTVMFLLLTPIDGLRAQAGYEAFFLDLSNIFSGVIIVMMYITSLSKKFN